VQLDFADNALRNQLWNVLHLHLWSKQRGYTHEPGPLNLLLKQLWVHHYELRIDEIDRHPEGIITKVKDDFLTGDWFKMYDILQFILSNYTNNLGQIDQFVTNINTVLERYLSGYRVLDKQIVDITSEQELESIEDALGDSSRFKPVNLHLKRALELLTDRENPDYRNSIKESISAVEALASVITNKPKATLGLALTEIERTHGLHSALKASFSSLYGWTSDASGIRHKLLDEASLKQEDAKFMLITCSAFINYLLAKMK
jgi:hypothetical protein